MDKTRKKIINCWAATTKGKKTEPGDIVVIRKEGKERITEIIKGFNWYFYVEKTDKSKSYIEELFKRNIIKKYNEGKRYIKIWFEKKQFHDKGVEYLIKDLHDKGITTFEADVGPAKRYLLDLDFEIEDFDNINLYYFDIETDDTEGKIEYEKNGDFVSIKAKDRILSVAFVDRKGESIFFHNDDEKTLLETVNKFLHEKEVDMLVGFNSKDFDIPYLWKRMQHHKINSTYIKNILHEDMKLRIQYFYSKDPEARQTLTSYSLNSLSDYFLGERKIERDGKVIDLMKNDFQKFKEYNIKDAQLLRMLEEKLGVIELTYKMFQMCQCTAQNWSMIKAIDNFLLYEANRSKIHYPTNTAYFKDIDEQMQYLGALVLDPTPGYYKDVYDLDFKSLYPNIIRTFNISPETLIPKIGGLDSIKTPGVTINNIQRGEAYFDKKEGIIPRKIKLLLDERNNIREKQKKIDKKSKEWRDLNVKQLIVKELANSIYGVIGNPYFRGFDINIAEAITATGQYLISFVKKYHEDQGRLVIYGDTDSLFIKIKEKENIEAVLNETNKLIENHLKKEFGVINCSIEMALDKVFSDFLIETKKKYVGVSDGKLKFVGMESIKRDTIIIAKRLQEELISKIFEKDIIDKEFIEWIKEIKESFFRDQINPEDVVIHKKMSKSADLYKAKGDKKYTPPLHVRIAKDLKISEEKTDITKGGSVVSYIVTNGAPLEGVHISQYDGKIDREYYWNNIIYPIMERMLEVAIPKVDWKEYYYIEENKNGNKLRRSSRSSKRGESSDSRTPRSGKKSNGDV